jgi:hypothetical protein
MSTAIFQWGDINADSTGNYYASLIHFKEYLGGYKTMSKNNPYRILWLWLLLLASLLCSSSASPHGISTFLSKALRPASQQGNDLRTDGPTVTAKGGLVKKSGASDLVASRKISWSFLARSAMAGALAGTVLESVLYPIETIKTRMQVTVVP